MCLLVYKQPNTTFPHEYAREAASSNRDGFGFAFHDGQRWQLHKTMELSEHLAALDVTTPFPALIHYRLATHGLTDTSNVHPFLVGAPDDPDAFVVAHNGIISIESDRDGDQRSDTRLFVEHVFQYLRPGWRDDAVLLGQIERMLGSNKVAVLFADGIRILFGERSGHWDADNTTWFSNNSYRRWLLPPRTSAASSSSAAMVAYDAAAAQSHARTHGAGGRTPSPVGWTYNAEKVTQEGPTRVSTFTFDNVVCDLCVDHKRLHERGASSMTPIRMYEVRPGGFYADKTCEQCDTRLGDLYVDPSLAVAVTNDAWNH